MAPTVALKQIYKAVNAEAAEQVLDAFDQTWVRQVPDDRRLLARSLAVHRPVLSLPADLRRAVYTTNSIENLNRQVRKSIKTRGHFPDEQAATNLIYLAIPRSERKWRQSFNWTGALRGLKIHFGDRLPD
jgi:transposase-like protein